ncbi:AraC family transcriptional regulator [Chamaesiphon sp. GL140_3_metabinner_50]|uniref:AraC family transcriptional regulator n=1 Tax=Chamaesiphon sp. GL140_3_metabinner_50 TaxID=2970812 RepID=UPI0025F02FB7|nr:AraC family transcriptional regulator [Chamaesiphon sp. GL140_3_metabinner_50]
MNLQSLPSQNSRTRDRLPLETIELEQPAQYRRTHRKQVEYTNQLEHYLSPAKPHQVLAKAIGEHQIVSLDSVSEYPFEIEHLNTGNFDLVDLQWHGCFKLSQQPQIDRHLIWIVLAGSLSQQLNAPQELPHQQSQQLSCAPETATIVNPGQTLESISSQKGKALLVSIDRNSIDVALSKLLARSLKQPLIFQSSVDLTSDLGLNLQKLLQFLWESAAGAGAVSAAFMFEELERAFLACALKGLPSSYSEEILDRLEGAFAAHVRKARTFIESNLHEDIKLGDIATAVGVCARLLQKAFSHQCGCSPMRFVTQTRLYRIRQELESPTSNAKIVDVMMDYGFTQGGKFAKEYQQLFGENPSDTLKRSNQFQQQPSPLWHQIDDAHSEQIVGGRSGYTTARTSSASQLLKISQQWQLLASGFRL